MNFVCGMADRCQKVFSDYNVSQASKVMENWTYDMQICDGLLLIVTASNIVTSKKKSFSKYVTQLRFLQC